MRTFVVSMLFITAAKVRYCDRPWPAPVIRTPPTHQAVPLVRGRNVAQFSTSMNSTGSPSWRTVLGAGLGSFAGIGALAAVHHHVCDHPAGIALIGSFGASAVLIYAMPESPLSSPRHVVGGHLISATVGVLCQMLLGPYPILAAAVAVAVAVMAMLLTRTTHPPGGATALIAVIGGPRIHELGFGYLLLPILAGAVILLAIAALARRLARRAPIAEEPPVNLLEEAHPVG